MLDRELHQVRQIVKTQLAHYPAAVGLNRLQRKHEDVCDLRAGSALDGQLQDFVLALAQPIERADAQVALAGKRYGDLGAKVLPTSICRAHSGDNIGAG